ncbi:MAG: ATP-binding protein [Acidimicrobiia bacterium]
MLRSRLASDRHNHEPRRLESNHPFVELRIPADPAYVRIARLAAGDMGGRAGFSVDELDDVRLAVDEVCATLIAAGGHLLELRMQARDRALIIEGRMPDAVSVTAPSDLSEMLLRALVDSCTFTSWDGGVSFEMHKLACEIA